MSLLELADKCVKLFEDTFLEIQEYDPSFSMSAHLEKLKAQHREMKRLENSVAMKVFCALSTSHYKIEFSDKVYITVLSGSLGEICDIITGTIHTYNSTHAKYGFDYPYPGFKEDFIEIMRSRLTSDIISSVKITDTNVVVEI